MQQRKKEKRKVGRGTNASFGAVSFEKQTNKQTNKHGTKEKLKVAGFFFFSEMVSQLVRITEAESLRQWPVSLPHRVLASLHQYAGCVFIYVIYI
jgi:hypothetical protein